MVGGGAKKAVTGVTPVTPRQSFQSVFPCIVLTPSEP